jgi:DNA-binding NarL/FixJ family response regulator
MASSDITSSLPLLRTPTLVLHPRESLTSRPEESMKLAAAIPGARMMLIDGATPLGDADQGIRAIERFLAELPNIERPSRAQGPTATTGAPDALSRREVEVLRLVASGKSNQQIADELVISLNTVARHMSNIFDKIGAVNRAEATSYAYRNQLI